MPKKIEETPFERTEHPLVSFIKAPYYIGKGIASLITRTKEVQKQRRYRKVVAEKRAEMNANYQEPKVLKQLHGTYFEFEKELHDAESKIGIILGARGTGKTAYGVHVLENMHAQTQKRCFAMGFEQEEMPAWITVVDDIEQLHNDSIVLIDEGGILFSSRSSMAKPNKLLSELLLIARHKNLTILFISQNSSNLDVNIIRQADFLVLKPSSLLQKDFERKKIKDVYSEVAEEFDMLKQHRGLTYIYADSYRGFVNSPLPSFWNQRISKSFAEKK